MEPPPSTAQDGLTGVGPLDFNNVCDVRAVARMHIVNFPSSTEARLGLRFLADIYYPYLVGEDLLACTVAHRDGQVVSFISYTRFPSRFVNLGLRARPLKFSWGIVRACLTRLDALRAIVKPIQVTATRPVPGRGRSVPAGCGEVLKLATEEEHQTWIPPGGDARVTVRVFSAMEDYFRRAGFGRVLLRVLKNNTASNLFCHSMGCRIDTTTRRRSANHYWYDISP